MAKKLDGWSHTFDYYNKNYKKWEGDALGGLEDDEIDYIDRTDRSYRDPSVDEDIGKAFEGNSTTGIGSASSNAPMITPEQSNDYAMQQLNRLNDNQKSTLEKWVEDLSAYLTQTQTNAQNKNPFGDFVGSDSSVKLAERAQEEKQALIDSGMPDVSHDNVDNMRQWREYQEYVDDYENRQRQQEELANMSGAELEAVRDIGAITSPLSNLASAFGAMEKPLDSNLGRNLNGRNNLLSNLNKDIDEAQHKKIEELAGNGVMGDALKFLYDTKNATIESLSSMSIGANALGALGAGEGVLTNLAGSAMASVGGGGAAYANQIEDGMRRGLTEEEAEKEALVASAIEMGTEAAGGILGMDVLRSVGKKLTGKAATELTKEVGESLTKKMLGEVASEAGEELVGNIAYSIADNIITGDKSVYNQAVKDYQAQGMSEEEARAQAKTDWIKDTAKEMAIAGLSAGVTMGGAAAVSTVAERSEAKKLDGNYKNVADAIPDNAEDYQDEEAYNKAMEVKGKALQLDEAPKVTSGERVDLLKDLYAVNETLPNTDLIENINESVNSPFTDVGGFQVAKNDITSQQVAQSMSQANNVNDFVEAYRDSQASSNAEARQTGQKYFDTLSPKFYTYDEGSRLLDNALSENTADELYTMALNGEEVAPELLNTQRKADYYNQGAERRNNLVELQNQLQEQRKAQELAEKESIGQTKIKKVETPQGKANIADISINNDGSFVWKKGEEEVVIPKKDISDRAMQQYMEYATSQPTLRAKQLYADNYVGSVPINSYNMAFNAAVNAGRTNYGFKSWLKSKPYFKAVGEEALQKFYDYGAEEAKGYNKTVKARKAVKSENKFGGVKTSDKGKLYIDGEVSDKIKGAGIYEIAKQFQKAHKTSVGIDYGTLIEKNQVAKVDNNGNIVRDANGNVETEEKDLLFNGEFRADLNQVLLGVNGKEYQTLSHEGIGEKILAYTAQEASELYDAMAIYLQDTMGAEAFNEAIQGYIDRYNKAGKKADFSYALYEYINDSLVGIFSTEKGQRDFVENLAKNEDKSLIDKFKELFNRLLNKVHQLVEDMKKNNQYTEGALKLMEAGEEQLQEWRDEVFRLLGLADERAEGTSNEESMAASLDIDSLESKKEFSLTEPIEKKGSLIAVHNRTAQDMLYAIEQGGIAMPSIAVTKTDMLHTNFGDVSVLYPSKVIDPQYADNYVYSGDAYTPITPRVEYKTNEDMVRDFGREVKEITKKLPGLYNSVSFYEVNYQDRLNSTGSMYEVFKNNPAVIYAYLKEKNIPIRTPYKDNVYDETKEMAARLLRHYTLEELKSMSEGLSKEKNLEVLNVLNQDRLNEYLKDHTQEEYDELPLFEKNMISMYDEKYHPSVRTENEIKDVVKYKTNGAKKVVDYDTLNKRLRKKINKSNEEDYKQWLSSKLDKAVIKKQYRNNKDYYTRSGNPRSWNQLHDDYTLDNAIRIMREGAEKGEGQFGYNIFGSSTVNYNSIDEIHADEDRLQERDYEEYKQLRSDINDELYRIANHIKPSSSWDVSSAAKDIAEAVATRKTKQGIKNWLSEWYNVENSDIDDIMNLVQEVREMPTTYFEAKPQRAVTLDEIAKVVVPSDATELITALEENNIPYNTYERDNEDSRREAVNSAVEEKDVRFSLDVPTTYALDEEYSPFIDDDIAETKESKGAFVEIIKAANSTLNYHISDKRIEDIADKVIAQYSSKIDKDFVTKNLRNIFGAMSDNNIEDMSNALINLSEEVIRQSEDVDPYEQENYEDFARSMPTFTLSENQKQEAINIMGDWNTVFAAVGRFLNNDSPSLDGNTYWEICDNALAHGYTMDREASDSDQLSNIISAIDALTPQSRALFEGADITDASLVTANEIMQQYYDYALKDKQANANLKDVKADLRKQVEDYKKAIGKQYQEQVKRLQKEIKDLKEQQQYANQQGQQLYDRLVKAENQAESKEASKEEVKQNFKDFSSAMPKFRLTDEQRKQAIEDMGAWNSVWGRLKNYMNKNAYELDDAMYKQIVELAKQHGFDGMAENTDHKVKEIITAIEMIKNPAYQGDNATIKKLAYENWQLSSDLRQAERMAQRDKMSISRQVEREARNKYLKSIRNQAIRTIKMLENPTRNKFIPEVLQKPTIEMLQTFDFVTYRVRKNGELVPWGEEKGGEPTKTNRMWREKMKTLQSELVKLKHITDDKEDLSKYGANSSYLYNLGAQLGDVTEGLLDQFLQDTQNDTVKISTLSSDKLKVLDDFMKSYLASINNAQEAMINGNNVQLAEVGQKIIDEISALKPLTSVRGKGVLDFLNLDMIEPYTIMSELGGTMEQLYWHLFSGKNVRDQHIFDTEKVFSDKKKELKLDDKTTSSWQSGLMSFKDGQLQLTPAQVMSLYAAYGRSQARHHIIFGGVMSADEALTKRKDKKKKKVQVKPIHLTPKDVEDIVNTLTPQQKALADFMVEYMSTEVSKWGNRVSQKRWGIRLFTESHYFPIKTYDVTRKSIKAEEGNSNSLFALQNQGFTKPLVQDANNALVLEDIFSVFADHVAKMAAYDGYVIPINDFMRVFNYAESQETFVVKQGEEGQHREDSSVKEQIERIFGKGRSTQYFRTFIKNINEDYGDNLPLNFVEKTFSRNKAQAVLANFRVVVQQPTAYPRAMEVIEGKYLTKALASNPVKNAKKSKQNNTLAMFKSKGYYETSIGQSMQQMITGNFTAKDKINEVAGALAGIADDLTWGTIYHAAELKVKAETKLKEGTKEFKDEVNKLANKAYAATQVVDSVFTKSQIMRSQNTGAKILTAFMAEPTKYYNMLHRGVFKTIQTGKKQFALKATYLFVVGQVLNAIVVSAVDAFRNDDDDKTWFSKYLNALLGIDDIADAKGIGATVEAILKANLVENLNPASLIPGVKEIVSALEGFDNKNMSTQAIYDIVKDAKKLVKDAEGNGNLTWYGKAQTLAEMVSLATGMPFSSALREVKTIHNTFNNLWGGDNWVKTEETTNPAVKSISTGENIREATKEQYEIKVQYFLDEGNNQKTSESKAKNSVKSSIRNKYKDKLAELKDKDINKANELKRNIIEAYMTLGDSQADANKTINGWMK